MALQSNDINDLNRNSIIESTDVSGQPGIVVLNPDGSAVGAPVGGATSANQTNGTQKTQIVDSGGEAVTVTGGKLDVNATASLAGETLPVSGATEGVAVAIVDGSGNQITSFGGGTQYTEGDTDATLTGTIAMAEGPSNTATPLQVDASNHLQVDIAATSTNITVQDGGGSLTVDNNGTFATQAAQSGTWNITNVSGTVSLPTGASTLTEQQSQTTHLSTIAGDTTSIQTAVELLDDTVATDGSATPTKGILMAGQDGTNAQTISTNSSGHINIADGGNTITVDGTVGVSGTVAVTQSGTWDEVGINDSGNSITVDYATTGSGTATGALRVELPTNGTGVIATVGAVTAITNALPAGTNAIGKLSANSGVDIGDVDVTSAVITGGAVAHDSTDSGNPIKIGFKAETSPKGITLVADGDRTDAYADSDGLQLFKPNTTGADLISEAVSNTDGSSTAFTNFSAVASTKNYITGFSVFRTDAGTTPIYVDFRDGTSGSVLWRAVIPAGGGANNPPYVAPALFKTSANTALAYDVSAATTTVYISVSGYQSKV